MKQIITIGLFVFACLQLAAQTLSNKIRSLTTEDGLPQGFVTGIVQDRQGFMWLGTRDGLARYDGRTIKVFRHEESDSNSLSGNVIRSLSLDPEKNIWVQYDNGSTDILNPATEAIRHLTSEPAFAPLISNKPEFGFTPFVFTNRGCAYRLYPALNPLDSRLVRVSLPQRQTTQVDFPAAEPPVSVTTDGQGLGWALTHSSLYQIDHDGKRSPAKRLPQSLSTEIASWLPIRGPLIFPNRKNGTLLLPTLKHLWTFDPRNEQWRASPWPNVIVPADIKGVVEATDGQLYLVAIRKIFRLEPDGGLTFIWENTLRYPDIITASVDRTNVLWVGTNTFGTRMIDLNQTGFHSYPAANDFFFDVLPALYRVKANSFEPYVYNNHMFIGRAAIDRNGDLWITNFLYKQLDGQPVLPNSLVRVRHSGSYVVNLDSIVGFSHEFRINNIAFDRENFCWGTTTRGNKLVKINPANGNVLNVLSLNDRLGFASHLLPMDSLLCIVHENALEFYNPATGQQKEYKDQPGVKLFRDAYLLMAARDLKQKKILWLASRGAGLLRFDLASGSVRSFTVKDGLPNNTVYGIVPDKKGFLWCSSNNGIFRFDPVKNSVLAFTEKDGLQGNEFNRYQYLQLPDGRFVFGGTQGWTIFHPDSIRIDNFEPEVAITDIAIQNEPIANFPKLKKAITSIDTLQLSYNQNFLTFRFAALQFNNPEKLQYRYRFSGIGNQWINTGNQNTANFTNLSPGEYRLQVNATNTAGSWSPHLKTITIIITPPWWKTWWAYLSYMAAIASVVFYLFRLRLKQARARQEAELKKKEAEQLKAVDEIKTRFFSNITHEFRTPLSLIISPVEQLQRDAATPGAVKKSLTVVQRNATQLLRLINQLLDMSKVESGSMQLSFSRGNPLLFVDDCVSAFKSAAYAKNIRLHFSGDATETEVLFDADKLEKIIYNLLSNAVKFTPEGGEISVTLKEKARTNNVQIHLQVSDSGEGISGDALPHIFDRFYQVDTSATRRYEGTGIGLALVRELVQLMNGSITVSSELQKGTTFDLVLPLQPAATQTLPRWEKTSVLPEEPLSIETATANKDLSNVPLLLVAEDNEELRLFISESLRSAYRVLTAANGKEALALAMEELPDLIISDVMMPVMDGYTFCRQIKSTAATEHIAFILLTAKAAHDSVVEGLGTGADDYLTKPFHFDELQLRLRNLLDRREKLRTFYQSQLKNPAVQLAPEEKEHPFISTLYTIIDEHLDDSTLSVAKLATKAAMSSRTLNRKLSSLVGLSANELIRQYRLKRSIEFLKAGSNVSEAAYRVGFETHAHFTTSFKAFYGLTPSEYMNSKINN